MSTADVNLRHLADIAQCQFDIILSESQLEQFGQYLTALSATKHNVTAIKDPAEIVIKHFADSLSAAPLLDIEPKRHYRLIDIGTGGGFPGVPLQIIFPDQLHTTLLDSTTKKITFLRNLTQSLGMQNVTLADMRTEDAGQSKKYRQQYDRVIARALAWMPVLVEYMLPLCKVGGLCLAMKGDTAQREVEEARCAIKRMGGKVLDIQQVRLPNVDDTRHIIRIAKVRPTPNTFPRRVGLPKKEPLLCD